MQMREPAVCPRLPMAGPPLRHLILVYSVLNSEPQDRNRTVLGSCRSDVTPVGLASGCRATAGDGTARDAAPSRQANELGDYETALSRSSWSGRSSGARSISPALPPVAAISPTHWNLFGGSGGVRG